MVDRVLAARARYHARQRLSRIPWLYYPLARVGRPQNAVSKQSDIVIEGFPRSGNTFANEAFRLAQRRPIRVASHLHLPIQVSLAVRWGIPCILLIRDPAAAAVSYVLYHRYLRIDVALAEYCRFYRSLLPLVSQVVVAEFSVATSDFGAVVDEVNKKYGRSFHRFVHSPENVRLCFRRMEQLMRDRGRYDENRVGRPSSERERQKLQLCEELQTARSAALLREANDVYQTVLTEAECQ